MSIQAFLDVSTAHLSPAARAWLSECATQNHAVNYHGTGNGAPISTLGATAKGWFMRAPALEDAIYYGMPEDLYPIIRRAQKWGVRYILFDADADVVRGLPTYED